MSWKANAWIQGCRIGGGNVKAVMYTVSNFCTEKGGAVGVEVAEGFSVCWASIDEIADDAECSTRTVKRVLADMQAASVIRRDKRRDRWGHRTTDLIWIEWARPFIVLTGPTSERDKVTDWHPATEPSTDTTAPVDNAAAQPSQGANGDEPRCHPGYGQGDTAMAPQRTVRNHSGNRQNHPRNGTTDRAGARGPPNDVHPDLARCA
jgi:hypothetical protein